MRKIQSLLALDLSPVSFRWCKTWQPSHRRRCSLNREQFPRCILRFGLILAVFGVSITSARAGLVTAYSNVTNSLQLGSVGGGATDESGNGITAMFADDITPVAGLSGLKVVEFTFSVGNFNAATVTARPLISIYASDNDGAPGSLITTITLGPIAFARGASLITEASPSSWFALPSGTFYAGISFDNENGTTGATLTQLNLLGQVLYNPPTVGSSQDSYFQAASAGSFGQSDPSGNFFYFGGSPLVANFGWEFEVSVPEPSSLVMSTIAVLVLTGVALRRRAGKLS